jgi:uncharacterized membrane protein YgaE (UPF0421/DUF939 family)
LLKFKIPKDLRVSEREYRANIEGINIVFGAVLGFVLAGAEAMTTGQFALLLLLSATVVVTILYLGSSEYRAFYGLMAIVAVAALPWLMRELEIPRLEKLQPTLGVWVAMVVFLELMPRRKEKEAGQQEDNSK